MSSSSTRGHRAQLAALATKDPEFYAFLKKEDADLLNFGDGESDGDEEGEEEGDEEEGNEPVSLGHLSDEEEEDENLDDESPGKGPTPRFEGTRQIIDARFLAHLESALQIRDTRTRVAPATVKQAVRAFRACVARVGADLEEAPEYVVNDEQVFDGIVRLCFGHLRDAFYSLLVAMKQEGEREGGDQESQSIVFHRLKKHTVLVKQYLQALLYFLNEVQTEQVIVATIKAIAALADLYAHFNKLARRVLQALMRIWSRKTAVSRRAAFTALCKFVRVSEKQFPFVLKGCYLGFVSSARAVSPETTVLLDAMHDQFADLCLIRPAVAYHYAFVYIRQIAIHLRNAMIAKRKDLVGTVYNWQVMQCLYLWARVIAKARQASPPGSADAIAELAYPLIQVVIGILKLYPSVQFFPLRLHCLRVLLDVQTDCDIYIPTLALACELFGDISSLLKRKPGKRASSTSIVRAPHVRCMLRMAPSQADQPLFRQALIDQLFRRMLEAAHGARAQLAFADIVVQPQAKLRAFVKSCRSGECAKLFRSLNEKIVAHARFTRAVIDASTVDLADPVCVKNLELRLADGDSPIAKFYETWQRVWKMRDDAAKTGEGETVSVDAASTTARKAKTNKATTKTEKEKTVTQLRKPGKSPQTREDNAATKRRRLEDDESSKVVVAKRGKGGMDVEIPDTIADLVMSDSSSDDET